jgi:hypothetical protein
MYTEPGDSIGPDRHAPDQDIRDRHLAASLSRILTSGLRQPGANEKFRPGSVETIRQDASRGAQSSVTDIAVPTHIDHQQ